MNKFLPLYIILLSFSVSFSSYSLEVLKVQGLSSDARFPTKVLIEAIKKGRKYELLFVDDGNATGMTESKLHNDLLTGNVDLLWTLTTPEYEERYETLYIPLYRGMLGMRIAIVRQDQKNIFANVHNLEQLQQFKAGQGTGWGDVLILEHNDLTVVQTLKYANLFPMLEGGRFDYFPRGVPEPWSEIITNAEYNLTVEPNLIFKYIAPMYFFSTPDNTKVIAHLKENIEAMIADGSYEELFFNHPDIKDALDNANLQNRRVINLVNPGLTSKTPLNRPELWFDPTKKS